MAVAGTPQSATVNTAFATALQALVMDTNGVPMSGVTVTFAVPGSGASATLSSPSATTNASGIAGVTATANTVAGGYSVTASIATFHAGFALTNQAGAPASIAATGGTPQTTPVNTVFPALLQATVRDAYGNAVPGASVVFAAPVSGASAVFAGNAVASTNAFGIATAPAATANGTVGGYQATASIGSLSASFSLANILGTTPTSLITLTASSYGPTLNSAVTLTATVLGALSAQNPTGTVTFTDNGQTIGTATLVTGVATIQDTIGPGAHVIFARYSGDSVFPPSTATLGLAPDKPIPGGSVTPVSATAPAGQGVTFNAQVIGLTAGFPMPTGQVAFYEGLVSYGTATLTGGAATFTTTSIPVGTHQISASYTGDANWSGVLLGTVTVTITATPGQ